MREEDDELTGAHCSTLGTARRRRKRRGSGVQANGDDDAELLDMRGRAKSSWSNDAEANSG